ncbi:AlpA family transcriptional regulator [Kosakonia sp. MUSA4]|uniref:helix-turn-helix transcriptional regulator n=1 Tax=Kosakonia sp. MUSA4 TaxID=2067958 RepID=UPI00159B3404|nr:AlpA family phage regulatory protein [Kosakonia sp. MUSA4]QJT82295.1 transcriptional regulator [Kosakonia sp. MUSA4]
MIPEDSVLQRIGLSNASLYRLIERGLFPTGIELTGQEGCAVGWLSSEIDNWISNRERVK